MPDGGTAIGGGAMGGLLPLLLGGGLGGDGCCGGSGLSPLLLLLLLSQAQETTTTTTDGGEPSTFADVLTANIGRRVRLILSTGNGLNSTGFVIVATIRAVNADYVVLSNICINGRPEPVLSRLNLLTSQILGVHPLSRFDEFQMLSCVLGSCW